MLLLIIESIDAIDAIIDIIDAIDDAIFVLNAPIPPFQQIAQAFDPLTHNYPTYLTNNPIPTNWNVVAVPEPETYSMVLAGLGFLGFMAKRRKQQAA